MSEPVRTVRTKEEQAALGPDAVRAELVAGNRRYVTGELTVQDHLAQLPAAAQGQHPMAIVLSCVDSRVPVEMIFDCAIGDLFVARVAGNNVNPDVLGSMEFACNLVGSKVVLVLGHQHCGAVAGAIDGVELGNLTGLLAKIAPAINAVAAAEGDRTSANEGFVADVTETNVQYAIARIRDESPILADMESSGAISIVGAVYELATGEVHFLD